MLSLLAKDELAEVRILVAGNVNTPATILSLLTNDGDTGVRMAAQSRLERGIADR
jgi:hypothetical protein